jgi:predicted nucleotidyltransferase
LPFTWDTATVSRGLNFTLTTTAGDLDLFGEVILGGTYEDLLPDTELVQVFGIECRCLSLDRLIAIKRAAGRPKDLDAIAELEAIAEERRR